MESNQKIRVCHLASGDLWAGAEVQIHTLLSTISSNPRIELSVILLNEGRLADQLSARGIGVYVIAESTNGFLTILSQLRLRLENIQPDILHTHRYKENILGGLAKKSGHVRQLVQTVHGLQESFGGFKRIKIDIYTALNRFYTKKYFDSIVAVSLDIARHIEQHCRSKTIVIHNSVDLNKLKVSEKAEQLRKELGLKEKMPVIGSVGRMVGIKGYDLFLKMAKLILKERADVQFLLVGDGPLKSDLESMASELGIADYVMFSGFRDDIIDVFSHMDIFVMSSQHEGIPTVLLEAMAMGKPAVCTAVGGISEIIDNENCGILVKARSAQMLADACLDLLSDSDRMKRMAISARQRIEGEFSSTIQAERTVELYQMLTGH